jgi:hypothetical protein
MRWRVAGYRLEDYRLKIAGGRFTVTDWKIEYWKVGE